MTDNLKFDFLVDKENNTININREFDANLELVWDAWTNPEILDQWWAPKPYRAETISMDFREGGMWLYAVINPENGKHWSKNDYYEIKPQSRFSGLDAFCDENGNVINEMPRTRWAIEFNKNDNTTLVTITAKYDSLVDLEKVLAIGFKEGFTMVLENLDQYFSEQILIGQKEEINNMAI
jgi:uncharacterized protein YndB with AHSA1/START domain